MDGTVRTGRGRRNGRKEDKEIMEHTIDPVYDEHSRILILGSFPSVKSREQKFFYGHKQNRFWKVLAGILGCEVPQTIEEKKTMPCGM